MNEFKHLSILIFLCFLLFFVGLQRRPLWDVDEGRHGATSREMVLSGDWITPKFNGKTFFNKPALFNWFVAASFEVLGFTEFAARLPAALLGLGTVLVTYALGRRMLGASAGFLGAVILATAMEFIILSRVVVHDIALAFFVTLALYAFYAAWRAEGNRRRFVILFYVATSFAVLAKGPLGLCLLAMVVVLFLLTQKRLGFIKEFASGWGILAFLAIALPWYVLISLENGDYVFRFFIEKNLKSLVSSEAVHQQPFYYYIPVVAAGFSPWSLFLPFALVHAFRRRREPVRPEIMFLLLWAGTMFLLFSVARSKLPTYILPLFPSLSLLVGVFWNDLITANSPGLRRGWIWSLLPIFIVVAGVLLFFLFWPAARMKLKYGVDSSILFYAALPCAAVLAIFLVLLLQRFYKASFGALAVLVVVIALLLETLVVPMVDSYRSTKTLALRLDSRLPAGDPIFFHSYIYDSALFYTGRQGRLLSLADQVDRYLASKGRVFFIIEDCDLYKLDRQKEHWYKVDHEGNKVVISNQQ